MNQLVEGVESDVILPVWGLAEELGVAMVSGALGNLNREFHGEIDLPGSFCSTLVVGCRRELRTQGSG